jgi:hypothetical protein
LPTFCRHNRLVQNCPICAREQDVELRPIVTGPRAAPVRSAGASAPTRGARPGSAGARAARPSPGVTVRRLQRRADDGYRSELVPGLKSSDDAGRLAQEIAFAVGRLETLRADPPGLYASVAEPQGDIEERSWLAFQIAYLGPLDGEHPFAAIEQGATTWSSGRVPAADELELGPRSSHKPGAGTRTLDAYRAWAQRAGSQAAALTGEPSWTPERRFARAFERLALPGLQRGAKFDLLVTLCWLGVYEMRAGSLFFGGDDEVTLAAKRLLGIGDAMLLDRRAAALAQACGLPLEALDVGFYNRERGERALLGMDPSAEADPAALDSAETALGL